MYKRKIQLLLALVTVPFSLAAVHTSQGVLGVKHDGGFGSTGSYSTLKTSQDVGSNRYKPKVLQDLLHAIGTMQDTYFDLYGGTWPKAIDWTAAVMGNHISATLSSLVLGFNGTASNSDRKTECDKFLELDNIINRYYTHTSLFYFGENAFALRNQAYDDMLWVVLGWLEQVKFAEMYSTKHWTDDQTQWHGLQVKGSAAHRARTFYELASHGWDTKLCNGGMVWNPSLQPYKNAITNELFTAASIGMYLFHPGDNNTSPFMTLEKGQPVSTRPHNPTHLENAVKSYRWLKDSGMRSSHGLYQDGFHVTGWRKFSNGTIDPGTGKCDSLNTMVYTYNQGVMLSASRGLWLATGQRSYLDDGHELIQSVITSTGWYSENGAWHGLGRRGVLEEYCDHDGYCSQDGQTFKGIFFHHLSEFCRPLWPQEEEFLAAKAPDIKFDQQAYRNHLHRCASYGKWIEHNAKAALKTKDKNGLFGMWWGVPTHHHDHHDTGESENENENEHDPQTLPPGATDHINPKTNQPHLPQSSTYDPNERGRGRTVETQSGGLAVLRAHYIWSTNLES